MENNSPLAPATLTATRSPLPAAAPPAASQTGLLTFLIGSEEFCLPVAQVREIRIWSTPTPLPQTDPALLGVINLRGMVLPVIDPSVRIGLPDPGPRTRPVIIVIDAGGRQAGVIADRVMDILAVASDAIRPPPAIATQFRVGSVAALVLDKGQLLRILDASHLLALRPESPAA